MNARRQLSMEMRRRRTPAECQRLSAKKVDHKYIGACKPSNQKQLPTRGYAVTEGPRDALCQL